MPQAIILLGGKGTRIQALYGDRPKCLVPVAGRPFLACQLEWLQRGGISKIHLAAGHMADVLRKWLDTNAPEGMTITVSVEPDPRGTGGAIKYAEQWIQSDPFLVLNGDTLAPGLDFHDLVDAHRTGSVVMAVAPVERTGRYGTVEFDAEHRVTAFLEKQEREQGWINAGMYCMSRTMLDRIAADRSVSIERDVFPALVDEGVLCAVPIEPPLLDMGTPEGLEAMNEWLKTNQPH